MPGLYRIWGVLKITFAGSAVVGLSASDSGTPTYNTGFPSYTAVAGEDIIGGFVSFEAGAFASSYIPTTTASVTRNADAVSGTIDSSNFNADGTGSWYIHGYMTEAAGGGGSQDPAIVEVTADTTNFLGHRTLNDNGETYLWSSGETAAIADFSKP